MIAPDHVIATYLLGSQTAFCRALLRGTLRKPARLLRFLTPNSHRLQVINFNKADTGIAVRRRNNGRVFAGRNSEEERGLKAVVGRAAATLSANSPTALQPVILGFRCAS